MGGGVSLLHFQLPALKKTVIQAKLNFPKNVF